MPRLLKISWAHDIDVEETLARVMVFFGEGVVDGDTAEFYTRCRLAASVQSNKLEGTLPLIHCPVALEQLWCGGTPDADTRFDVEGEYVEEYPIDKGFDGEDTWWEYVEGVPASAFRDVD
jgi:hypothetical protein